MKTFYSTFITGFSEVVKQTLLRSIKDAKIELLSDGLIIYKTETEIEEIKSLRFFNNSFLLLKYFPKLGNSPMKPPRPWKGGVSSGSKRKGLAFRREASFLPALSPPMERRGIRRNEINEMFRQCLNDKRLISMIHNSLPKKRVVFRVMAMKENQFIAMDKRLLSKLENFISQEKSLILNRSKPEIEFLFSVRREGYGLFGLRLTRHTSYEKILEKGEIYPELANILCFISEPKADDIFLDPFCGSGAIPLARAIGFPSKVIYAGDIEKKLIDKVKIKIRKISSKIIVGQWNALKLNTFADNSIDKIVTDPPWGIYQGKELNLKKFYRDMLMELWRVLRSNGLLVIMVAKKELFEEELNKFPDKLSLLIRYDTLVSGQKAGVYQIRKV